MNRRTALLMSLLLSLCPILALSEAAETVPALFTALEDGVYLADFTTDSSMFHLNEISEGKGTLTVSDGKMTIHITLGSKNIVYLYPGTAEDAKREGAVLLQPTLDAVAYPDGYEEEVYGFNVPVPVINEEFDLAVIGRKGKWYDHRVMVSNPAPLGINANRAD